MKHGGIVRLRMIPFVFAGAGLHACLGEGHRDLPNKAARQHRRDFAQPACHLPPHGVAGPRRQHAGVKSCAIRLMSAGEQAKRRRSAFCVEHVALGADIRWRVDSSSGGTGLHLFVHLASNACALPRSLDCGSWRPLLTPPQRCGANCRQGSSMIHVRHAYACAAGNSPCCQAQQPPNRCYSEVCVQLEGCLVSALPLMAHDARSGSVGLQIEGEEAPLRCQSR